MISNLKLILTCGVCNSFFRLELECILPGGEFDITNGYSFNPSIDLRLGLSRELNPNETGPEDLKHQRILFLSIIYKLFLMKIFYTYLNGPYS